MSDDTPCQIKCKACGQWADSRVQFKKADAFFTSTLIGKTVVCTWCGENTPCTIENMRFYDQTSGACIGKYIEGKDVGRAKRS